MARDIEQLKSDMEAKIVFRGRWFEEEYQPDLHGNPYAIIAKDVVEVAAAHLIKKHISELLTAVPGKFSGGGVVGQRIEGKFTEKIPRPHTSVIRFM